MVLRDTECQPVPNLASHLRECKVLGVMQVDRRLYYRELLKDLQVHGVRCFWGMGMGMGMARLITYRIRRGTTNFCGLSLWGTGAVYLFELMWVS